MPRPYSLQICYVLLYWQILFCFSSFSVINLIKMHPVWIVMKCAGHVLFYSLIRVIRSHLLSGYRESTVPQSMWLSCFVFLLHCYSTSFERMPGDVTFVFLQSFQLLFVNTHSTTRSFNCTNQHALFWDIKLEDYWSCENRHWEGQTGLLRSGETPNTDFADFTTCYAGNDTRTDWKPLRNIKSH